MKAETFEDIIAWQRSKELAVFVYKLFRRSKDFSFRDQIQRAVISIGNNIAEGFERRSNSEFRQFLFIAKGSAGEVRSMLLVAVELEYISKQEFDEANQQVIQISKMISGFIKTL